MGEKRAIVVQEDLDGERLDIFLAEQLDGLSRAQVQKLISAGRVLVDGQTRKASYRVQEGETVVAETPSAIPVLLRGEDIPLDILYQDSDVVVVNKPKGLVVHPAHGNWEHTLVNALLHHVKTLSSLNGELRPGIVHRLDKDTSGILVAARNDSAHRALAEQMKAQSMRREYLALVHGMIREVQGTIEAPIGRSKSDRKKMAVVGDGRPAFTRYRVIERFEENTLLRLKLITGRTHQIRVHMQYIKHPVVGDPLYSRRKAPTGVTSQLLHACLLGFIHPRSGEYMEFSADLPAEFRNVLSELHRMGQ